MGLQLCGLAYKAASDEKGFNCGSQANNKTDKEIAVRIGKLKEIICDDEINEGLKFYD